MYHQQDMEEAHKYTEVLPTVDPREWHKTLETVKEYIRRFCGVYGQLLSYGLKDNFIDMAVAHDPRYCANKSD